MSLFNLFDDEVTLDELKLLIVNKTSEKRTIDYKLTLELDGDKKKKEFLADITSFANTSGGVLIYGMREEDSIPVELVGITSSSYDILKGQIESIIRDGIAPKLNTVIVKDVSIIEDKKAIVIKIPQSWSAPHLVWFKRSSKFYARNSSHGKYQLEISEIRSSILASEYLYDKIRNFRLDRVSKKINNDIPIPLDGEPKFVFHLIPLSSYSITERIDNQKIENLMHNPNPFTDYKMNFNFDGAVFHNNFGNEYPGDQYIQVFRNGIIETVNNNFTKVDERDKLIKSSIFELFYINNLPIWLSFLKHFGYGFPFIIFLSVLCIKDYTIYIDNIFFRDKPKPIKQDNLLIHDLLLEDITSKDLDKQLKILFDPIWNACNLPRSMNYDLDGNRIKNK